MKSKRRQGENEFYTGHKDGVCRGVVFHEGRITCSQYLWAWKARRQRAEEGEHIPFGEFNSSPRRYPSWDYYSPMPGEYFREMVEM